MLRIVPGVEIRKIILSVLVRGLENRIIITDEYVVLMIFIDRLVDNIIKTVCFIVEVYLIKDLKANLLINNNIIIL